MRAKDGVFETREIIELRILDIAFMILFHLVIFSPLVLVQINLIEPEFLGEFLGDKGDLEDLEDLGEV